MITYKIRLELRSSIRTPFHADTIFGHLCWAMRYIEGEARLKKWLAEYKKSPTLISNAFKSGLFPRPVLPPCRLNKQELSSLTAAALFKKMKNIGFIGEPWVYEHQSSLSAEGLTTELERIIEEELKDRKKRNWLSPTQKTVAITHNTYDRLNGRALEGSLYDWDESFYLQPDQSPQLFWFLIKTETMNKGQIEKILEFIALSGFGADKSIGKGQIEIRSVEENSLPTCTNANAFISLSNFIPNSTAELNGYYKPITKFGRLGGGWAAGRVPFKKPVVMLQAGAVIKDDSFSNSKIYGKLQGNIHHQKEIVQYGYAFPFPVFLKE